MVFGFGALAVMHLGLKTGPPCAPYSDTSLEKPRSFTTVPDSGVPINFFRGRGGGSTNSVDRGQREQGSGGGSPLVRGSAQFANG
jgi:hypothetical protein